MPTTAQVPSCPVCSGDKSVFVLRADANVYRCSDCSHVFSDPSSIAQQEKYEESYYQEVHKHWFEHPNIRLFSWIAARLPGTTASVLDAGCGDGAFLKFLRARKPTVKPLVGVDYSVKTGQDAGIEFVAGDLKDLPADERFDAVVRLAVIEHVADPLGFAQEIAAHCKTGGTAVVMTLNNDSLLYTVGRLCHRLGVRAPAERLYSSHHLQHFTAASLRLTLGKAGLHVIASHRHNTPLAAIDIPAKGDMQRVIFMFGVWVLYALGSLTGKTYSRHSCASYNAHIKNFRKQPCIIMAPV